ncbi:MAG: hypothetical protein WBF34_04475 [Streptosporangiaceae bacterium]
MTTVSLSMPDQRRRALPGEELTRRAITVITAAIVAMALAFSVVNVTRLCLDLGVIAWIAWLIGPSVDLSVIGLLTGIRFLSLHSYTEERLAKLNRFLRLCGLLTLALNTAGALWHLQFGTAAVDAIGPVLLIDQMRFGNLDFIKVGRRRLITRQHLERFLDIDPMAAPTQGSAG